MRQEGGKAMDELWQYEREALAVGHTAVCGCDEAGAGPLAGPVYAAAVILAPGTELPGLNDSKKLTEKKREALFPLIQEKALSWAVAWVDAEEIDCTDILSARMKAMQLAIDRLNPTADFALIDGNRDRGRSAAIITEHRMIIKGDSLSASIAAASILAKVSRDHWMVRAAEEYPQYQFDRHKGYGTKLMEEVLRRLSGQGYLQVFLFVLRENENARRFYEKMGFAWDGTHEDIPFPPDTVCVDLRYTRSLP